MKVLKLGSLLLLLLGMPLWAHASAPLLLEQPVTLQNPADLNVLYVDAETTAIPPAMTQPESADEAAPDAADATVQAVSKGTE